MTIKKKRRGIITLIASAFIAVFGAIGVSLSDKTMTASAATSNRYIYFAHEYSDLNKGDYVQQKHTNSITTNTFSMDKVDGGYTAYSEEYMFSEIKKYSYALEQ